MSHVFYLHIAGTENWDCKWFFTDENQMDKFLRSLPLTNMVHKKEVKKKQEDGTITTQTIVRHIEEKDIPDYWDEHTTILQICLEKLSRFHKLFKAAYWDESYLQPNILRKLKLRLRSNA